LPVHGVKHLRADVFHLRRVHLGLKFRRDLAARRIDIPPLVLREGAARRRWFKMCALLG